MAVKERICRRCNDCVFFEMREERYFCTLDGEQFEIGDPSTGCGAFIRRVMVSNRWLKGWV